MNCPNCDYDIEDMQTCPQCGIDPVLFMKTGNISNQLYNRALQQIKSLDLTSAVDNLVKSLEFNKNNYVARNLLGLVYYEIGRIGDALRHWVISSSIMRVNNPAADYIEDLQKNARTLERYADAVRMYNNALNYISLKNEDMAMIQLKKAIEINPKFVDALNLLSFCYLIQTDKDRALQMIERVLAVDANNPIALHYYNEIFPSRTRPEPATRIIKTAQPRVDMQSSYSRLSPKDKKSFGEAFHVAEIVSFVLGGLCVAAVMYILFIPAVRGGLTSEIETLKKELDTKTQSYENQLAERDSTIVSLQGENAQLRGNYQELNEEINLQRKIQLLDRALSFRTSNVEEAAGILYDMEPVGLPADKAEQYQSLKAELYPKATLAYHNTGVQRFNAGNYEEARSAFEKCLWYAEQNSTSAINAYLYLGRIAKANDDVLTAKEYFNKVINDYPNSSQANTAQQQLRTLE